MITEDIVPNEKVIMPTWATSRQIRFKMIRKISDILKNHNLFLGKDNGGWIPVKSSKFRLKSMYWIAVINDNESDDLIIKLFLRNKDDINSAIKIANDISTKTDLKVQIVSYPQPSR